MKRTTPVCEFAPKVVPCGPFSTSMRSQVDERQVGRLRAAVAARALHAGRRHLVVVHGHLLLTGRLHAAHDVALLAVAGVVEREARHLVGEVREIVDAHVLQRLLAEGRDRRGDFLQPLVAALARRDHDLRDQAARQVGCAVADAARLRRGRKPRAAHRDGDDRG